MITELDQQDLERNWIDVEKEEEPGISLPPCLVKLDIRLSQN